MRGRRVAYTFLGSDLNTGNICTKFQTKLKLPINFIYVCMCRVAHHGKGSNFSYFHVKLLHVNMNYLLSIDGINLSKWPVLI